MDNFEKWQEKKANVQWTPKGNLVAYTSSANLAEEYFPNEKDLAALWHADYFRREPKNFLKSVMDYSNSIPEQAEKIDYQKTIRTYIDRNFTPAKIQEALVKNFSLGSWWIANIYPDWGEWWNSYRIAYDLENWIKDTFRHQNEVIKNDVDRANYVQYINGLLQKYAPENWPEKISRETLLTWIPVFKKDEIEDIKTAEMELKNIKNSKMIGYFILGGFGLFGLSYLLRQKR